jgi:hypothetical protein
MESLSKSPDDILEEVLSDTLQETPSVQVEELSSDNKEPADISSVPEIPLEFPKLITDFISDISTTFPEYTPIIKKWWGFDSFTSTQVMSLFVHCLNVYPSRFTDIIYQKEHIFADESSINVDFLPGISFKYLWNCDDVSENIRSTIWKYLQSILICVVGTAKSDSMSEDMKKLFDTMSEDSIKDKLQDTINGIQQVFENNAESQESSNNESSTSSQNNDNTDNMQSQINNLMGGKLGELAQEIAEETAQGLNLNDFDGTENVSDVFKKVFANPGNFMNLVQNVTSKLDTKMQSGEFQQQDLMKEATDILQNMKDIPGMGNIQEMMSNMTGTGGMGGDDNDNPGGMPDLAGLMGNLMGGGNRGRTRVDQNAVERQVKRTNQITQMKQRIEKKKIQEAIAMQKMQEQVASAQTGANNPPVLTDKELEDLFNDSNVSSKQDSNTNKKKKSKNKK